jgi:hypothetical protein
MSQKPPPLPTAAPRSNAPLIISIVVVALMLTVGAVCLKLGTVLRGPAARLFNFGQSATLIAEGDRLSDGRDFAGAAEKYRAALRKIPKRSVHFRLNVQWKLMESLRSLEEYEEQIVVLREMHAAYTKRYGKDHENSVSCARWLGDALMHNE